MVANEGPDLILATGEGAGAGVEGATTGTEGLTAGVPSVKGGIEGDASAGADVGAPNERVGFGVATARGVVEPGVEKKKDGAALAAGAGAGAAAAGA